MIQGIILAAGLSTRMGQPKLLIEIGGVPLIRRSVQAALDSALDRVILVLGPTDTAAREVLGPLQAHSRLRLTVNRYPAEGMSSSLRVGMGALSAQSTGVMIILADQPWLTSTVIDRLVEAFTKNTGKIVAPALLGRRTTPVVFPSSLFDDLMLQTGDVGGRYVLTQNLDKVVELDMGSYYDDTDIDTPEDLERIGSRLLKD